MFPRFSSRLWPSQTPADRDKGVPVVLPPAADQSTLGTHTPAERPAEESISGLVVGNLARTDEELSHVGAWHEAVQLGSLATSKSAAQEYPGLVTQYGPRWKWKEESHDYVRPKEDGDGLWFYATYQLRGLPPPEQDSQGDEPKVVAKPKRFFQPGRVFSIVWFEPATQEMLKQNPDALLNEDPRFPGGRAVARSRWFVVVRRRPHHSLCFKVATYSGKDGSKTSRGRPSDFVVLYRANIEPAAPFEDEGITRGPIAVIIEAQELLISPITRLDCGRIYTVEDNLTVAKVGRVHPYHLPLLEQCFEECLKSD